jgi:ABC-type nitrate/sulfonate/bicarbonate transport system ATPase subunit
MLDATRRSPEDRLGAGVRPGPSADRRVGESTIERTEAGKAPEPEPERPVDAFALEGVSFAYRRRRREFPVLTEVSVALRRGEVVTVVGPSGCGKSTLLAVGAGLRLPSSGRVVVNGERCTGRPGRVGLMLQQDELFPWRTVLQNVLLGPEILDAGRRRESVERARELIALAGLAGFEDHYPAALSGGMRQRVAFLRTLMLDRSVVLLDEPFGALDAITRAEMQEWLLRLWEQFELTLLLVTHDVDEAIFLSDRVLVLHGRPAAITLEAEVPFGRPRDYEAVVADRRFGELKSRVLHAIRSGRGR